MSELPEPEERQASTEAEQSVPILDPSEVAVETDENGQLVLRLSDGTVHRNVTVAPAFPISRPNRFVYFFDSDGGEVGLLTEPRRLDRESRERLLTHTDQAYFMPRITRIINVDERPGSGLARWDVETDRGDSIFEVVSRSESVWYVGKNRIVIRDADGNRYLIEDLTALDRRSRRLAELHM